MAANLPSTGISIYDTMLLGASGIGYCRLVEGHAAITLIPYVAGLGFSIAYNHPVAVEACVERGVVLEDQVTVRVWGPGLPYSSSPLQLLLLELGKHIPFLEDSEIKLSKLFDIVDVNVDLLVASMHGTAAVIGRELVGVFKNGLWLVAIRVAEKPTSRIIEGGHHFDKLVEVLSSLDVVDAVNQYRRLVAGTPRIPGFEELPAIVDKYAVASTLDAYGEFYIALVDDYGLLLDLVSILGVKGFRFSYGRLV